MKKQKCDLIQALNYTEINSINIETRKLPTEVTKWQKKFAKILYKGRILCIHYKDLITIPDGEQRFAF